MNYQSELKKVKQGEYEYIYIYFKHKGNIIRINTKNRVVPNCMTKELLYNSKMIGQNKLNLDTKDLKLKVDEYIRFKIVEQNKHNISKEECLLFMKGGKDLVYRKWNRTYIEETTPKSKTVNDYLTEFNQFKILQLNNRPSYKDYLTLVNSLTDFQKYYGIKLTFEYLDTEEFLIRYRNFLSIDRGKDYKEDGYKTRGGLNDNTINKRFSGLKTFYLWIENRNNITFKKSTHSFSVPKYDNNIIVLDNNDIKQFLEKEIINETWIKIRDLFVCNCYMGLRISDLKTIVKSDFQVDEDGDYFLVKENQKTKFYVEIPIQPISLDILKKYDFELPKFSDQYFNRELKNILKKYELFSETIVKKRRSNKDIQDKKYLRRELITSHTCRRSYITTCISKNVPLNSLMLSTGHKKIQTLQKSYMKKVRDKESFKGIDL